jgi:hypothetical protein
MVAVLTAVIGGFFASKLSLRSDLAELLPKNLQSVKALERIQDEVGGIGNIKIIVESKDLEATKSFLEALAPELLQSPLVNYLDYKNDVAFYKKYGLLLLSMDELDSLYDAIKDKINQEKQKLNPFMIDDLFEEEEEESDWARWEEEYEEKEPKEYYVNEDNTVLVMKVIPVSTNTNLSFVRDFFYEVKRIVDSSEPHEYASDINILYGGNFKTKLDEYEVVKKDILGTALIAFGGVFFLIFIYFRRFVGSVLITLSLLISLAWTFGTTYWIIGELNTITGFLFIILFGLGIDYGIHAFARYSESRRFGLSFEQSMEKLVGQTGKALVTTAVTTSAAFFSLTIMKFKGFSDLGFIAGAGILFTLVSMVVVLPAFITLAERLGVLNIKPEKKKLARFQRKSFKFSKTILVVSGVIGLFAIYCFFRIEFEYDFTNLRANIEQRTLISEKTKGVFKESESPAVVLAGSKQEADDIFGAVEKIMKEDTLSPTVEDVKAAFVFTPEDQREKIIKIRQIRNLVEEEAEGVVKGEDKKRLDKLKGYLQVDKPFAWDELPEQDRRKFLNKKGEIGNFVFIYPSVPLRDGKNAIEFRNDIGQISTASGKTYYASSSNIILADMLSILLREGKLAVLLAFFVVFVIVFLDLRKLRAALFVLTPLVLGILCMGVVMFFSCMKFNLFNIVVIPSIIGIGVDNGVHIYHRYREEGPGSLYYVLKNTGFAITMTTSTTIVGYSGLILARHPGLNSIGDLAVIGLISAYITALVVLPALLQFFGRGKEVK